MADQKHDKLPSRSGASSAADNARHLQRDLKTLALFIRLYCENRHPDAPKATASIKTHDVKAIVGKDIDLCRDCEKLLAHAFYKRSHCPMNPKPACKHCPSHCYHPDYRARIQEVMRFSGRHMVMHGRLDYLYHLLF